VPKLRREVDVPKVLDQCRPGLGSVREDRGDPQADRLQAIAYDSPVLLRRRGALWIENEKAGLAGNAKIPASANVSGQGDQGGCAISEIESLAGILDPEGLPSLRGGVYFAAPSSKSSTLTIFW
jgi:hypothetical protein